MLVLVIAHGFSNLRAKPFIVHINRSIAIGVGNINNIAAAAKLHAYPRYIAIGSGVYRVTGLLVCPEI